MILDSGIRYLNDPLLKIGDFSEAASVRQINSTEVIIVRDLEEKDGLHDAVVFNVQTLSSRKVLESTLLFTGDMRYIADGQVLIWDEVDLGKISLQGETWTFEIL